MKIRMASIAASTGACVILAATLLFGQLREVGFIHPQNLAPELAYTLPSPRPVKPLPVIGSQPAPPLSSTHWEIVDVGSGEILADSQPNDRVAIASLTKLMTAYLVRQKLPLSKIIEITPEDTAIGSDDSRMGLAAGERITVEDLLRGLLIPSGDDAALALARASDGSVASFVREMNTEAKALRLSNSHFVNPSGLDAPGHYSSAADLSRLARLFISDPTLKEIAATRYTAVRSATGQLHQLYTTNSLLGQDGVTGIKTGHTDAAGDCLVSLEIVDGHEIIATLLGSADRFGETEALINWAKANTRW